MHPVFSLYSQPLLRWDGAEGTGLQAGGDLGLDPDRHPPTARPQAILSHVGAQCLLLKAISGLRLLPTQDYGMLQHFSPLLTPS